MTTKDHCTCCDGPLERVDYFGDDVTNCRACGFLAINGQKKLHPSLENIRSARALQTYENAVNQSH